MKNFALILLSVLVSANYIIAQTQQDVENQTQPKSDKLYLGCWISEDSRFVYFNEKYIQVSWTSEIFAYFKTEFGNENAVVLKLKRDSKSRLVKPYIVLKVTGEDEMTLADYLTKDYPKEQRGDYLNLKRKNCEEVFEKLKKK